MTSELRGLTVRQPWAQLIADGVKRIETRSWTTRYRGRVVIHAGKAETIVWPLGARSVLNASACNQGVTLATAELVDIVSLDELPLSSHVHGWVRDESVGEPSYIGGLDERLWGNFDPEWFGWLLDDVRPCVEVACSGRMGLWNVPPKVREQLDG